MASLSLVSGDSDRPVLAVDVDGVISLFGFDGPLDQVPGNFHLIDGVAHCIADGVGRACCRLADHFEMVWATGWEERAKWIVADGGAAEGAVLADTLDEDDVESIVLSKGLGGDHGYEAIGVVKATRPGYSDDPAVQGYCQPLTPFGTAGEGAGDLGGQGVTKRVEVPVLILSVEGRGK